MAQPPSGPPAAGVPPAPAPAAPVTPPYPYYAPPPPKRTNVLVIVVVIVVVLAIVVTVVIAAVFFLLSGLVGPEVNTPPAIGFAPASLSGGNATLTVAAVSREASIALFTFRLQVGTAGRSSPQTFSGTGVARLVSVAAMTFQVTWNDTDTDGALSLTDTILIAGDGAPLGAGSYVFELAWVPTGQGFTSVPWTVP